MGEIKLVDDIRIIVNKIIEERGEINLFMLLLDEDSTDDTFTILISSKWLDFMDAFNGTKLIAEYLIHNLPVDKMNLLSRITAIKTTDHQVIDITKSILISGGIAYMTNCRFGNVIIPNAIILESVR